MQYNNYILSLFFEMILNIYSNKIILVKRREFQYMCYQVFSVCLKDMFYEIYYEKVDKYAHSY